MESYNLWLFVPDFFNFTFLRLIMVQHVSVLLFLLIAEWYSMGGCTTLYESIPWYMDIWVVSAFWFSWLMLLWMFAYKLLCGSDFPVFSAQKHRHRTKWFKWHLHFFTNHLLRWRILLGFHQKGLWSFPQNPELSLTFMEFGALNF